MNKGGLSAVYPALFQSYTEKFNWSYFDGYEELNFIQQSWLFSVYMLQRLGEQWQTNKLYEHVFLQAFPMLTDEVVPSVYNEPATHVMRCYRLRVLLKWMELLGLAEIENKEENSPLSENYMVRKLPLADALFTFHI